MAALTAILLGDVSAAWTAPRQPVSRLVGLERLYFERVDLAALDDRCAGAIAARLPARLDAPAMPAVAATEVEAPTDSSCDEIAARDFPLPLDPQGAVLREVVSYEHPRIHDQYWCLYGAGGERGECWFFAPDPERTDDKLLSSLLLQGSETIGESKLVLRVSGTMMRPRGAWWGRGADLSFVVAGEELRYVGAVVRYTVVQPYDREVATGERDAAGEELHQWITPPPMVASERLEPSSGTITRREVAEVSEKAFARCGVTDTAELALEVEDWDELASCLVAAPDATVRRRRFDEPAFIERGWRDPDAP